MTPKHRASTLALIAALAVASCSSPAPPAASPSASQSASAENAEDGAALASELKAPWSIAFYRDVPLISERDTGRILALRDGLLTEVATIEGVQHGGEGGLLGLAVTGDDLFVYSTAEDGNRVQRYGLTDDGGQLRLSEPETILEGIPAAGNHNGGRIAFGPDGKLYVGTGDAGQRELSQDLDSLAGKILRLNPDGSRPADNPFDGSFVYSYGHRNVQGLAWTADGTMYASEFGASTFDELNRIEPGGNYGWPEAEGDSGGAFLDPVAQWATSEASPSGIAIRGEDVFIANLRGRSIRRVNLADPSKQQLYLDEENTRFRDVAVSPTGEVWVLTNNTDGRGDPGPDDDRLLRLDVDD
ncbi:PQQ-dependent sugar dehydrogenase [Bowdeniella massiliensis]|uniref:PQQ-dependent sugar dehydrogenase n=1 Tax=Bowdeniella massiliensis TaxID=2932264 RepID=UPI002027D745|nr:PQQ-dependent sugar dehydrogenase [Bowdeniella massiliensis]